MKKINLFLFMIFFFIVFAGRFDAVDNPFPKIVLTHKQWSVEIIKKHILKYELGEIKNNQIRLFIQPNGIMSSSIVTDLKSKKATKYPGTHDESNPKVIAADGQFVKNIVAMVNSDRFKEIEQENRKVGFDGKTILLETKIDNNYSYKIHWETDDQYFLEIIDKITGFFH